MTDPFVAGERCRVDGAAAGPLAGLTVAVKDLIDVAGWPTGGGNPDWARWNAVPTRHATAVARLLEAGASVIGKTVTDEISLGILGENPHDGTPLNPAAPGRVPGGSSSGSASAVASGLCDTALGTDTGGSVRVPASFCGLYGIRPTHGRVPFDGIAPQAPTSDTCGWFARDAETFARVGAVLLGSDIQGALPTALVIGADAFGFADPAVAEALRPHVARLAALIGASTERTMAPQGLSVWMRAQRVAQGVEASATFAPWLDATNPRLAYSVARGLVQGAAMTEQERAAAALMRMEVRARMARLLPPGTILCLPTTPAPALPLASPLSMLNVERDRIACLACVGGLAGHPQVNLPGAMVDGLPVGLSIIGPRGSDETLLAVAQAFARTL